MVRKTHFPSLEPSTQSNVKKVVHVGKLIYFPTKFSTFHAIKQSLKVEREHPINIRVGEEKVPHFAGASGQ